MSVWVRACGVDDIEEEDVLRFDHGDATYAVYRTADGTFHATDGLCTHEQVHLAEGFVMDGIIECPRHMGRFRVATGEAVGGPVCVDLKTYPVRVEDDAVLIDIG